MDSVYDKIITNQPICNVQEKLILSIYSIIFLSIRVRISWNIEYDRNLFLKLKSKLRLHHVVFTTAETSPKKLRLTVVEMQQLPDIEKTDSKEEICLNWTIYNGRRKVCVNFKNTDKMKIVVYRYRNS